MSERAVSEVISYVLVFALITSAVAIISVSGFDTIEANQNAEQIQNAERAYDVLSDNLADIHQRGAPSRATEISLSNAQLSTGSNVTIGVNINNGTVTDSWVTRPIVYSGTDDRTLVYSAGAIYRTGRNGDFWIQDPPFILKENQVLLPIVGLTQPNVQSVGEGTALVRAEQQNTTVSYADEQDTVTSINVSVNDTDSPELWRSYFNETGFDHCWNNDTHVNCENNYSPGTLEQVYVVYHDIAVTVDR